MNKDDLDAKIIEAVRNGKTTFTAISNTIGRDGWLENVRSDTGRLVDRRLQSLRKRGVLIYAGQRADAGWRVAPTKDQS